MGNENSMMPSPKQSPKAEGQEQISSSSAFPYVRGSREARLRSHKITREMQKQFSDDQQIVKILLLGAGESGKSTIVKQMKLLHPVDKRTEVGFDVKDKQEARKAIYSNVTDSIINLVHAVEDLNIPLSINEDKGRFEESKANVSKFWNEIQARDKKYQAVPRRNCFSVGDASDKTVINPSIASETTSSENVCSSDPICPCPVTVSALKYLWTSPCIQKAYERRNEFQLTDSAAYFLGDLDRLCVHEYEPTDDDVLRSRVQTLGIVKIEFIFRHLMFNMYDVAGQKAARRKWIHCFDNVTAVLFVIGMSEYDQVLAEDGKTNRMEDSLTLFGATVNGVHLRKKPFILFFNKHDLFEEKVKKKSIQCAFPDYRGDPRSVPEASQFIIDKFLEQDKWGNCKDFKRPIYPHLVTATNTQLVKFVFTGVAEIILNDILKDVGLT